MRSAAQRELRGKGEGGFTLIELVIVMTIVALAAVLVVPNMARAFADAELRLEARTTANLFLQARERAVFHGRTCLIVFGADAHGRRKLFLADDDGRVVNEVEFPAGLVLREQAGEGDWTEQPPPVYFFPNGTSQALKFDLEDRNSTHVLLRLDPVTGRLHADQLYKGE